MILKYNMYNTVAIKTATNAVLGLESVGGSKAVLNQNLTGSKIVSS